MVTKKYVTYIIIAFATIIAIGLIGSVSPQRTSGDFDVYYSASHNYLAKSPIYIPHGGIEEFKYLPLFALFFLSLTIFGKIPALYLWSILNILLLYFMFYFLYKLKQISFDSFKDFLIIFFLFAVTGRYIFANIKIGQVNIILCFFLVLTMYFEINKKYLWAALALALSLMIKLSPSLFLGYFIMRRRFKLAGYTILLTLAFLLLPAIYSGFGLNLKYLQEWAGLLKSSPAVLFYSVKNYSLLAFWSWLFVVRHEPYFILDYHLITKGLTPGVYYAWAVSCFTLFSLFFYDNLFKKDKKQEIVYLDYACLFVCAVLFNPLSYLNTLTLLIIPYFFILRYLFYLKLPKIWAKAAIVLVVISFILPMVYNKFFFSDIKQFYDSLIFRLPMLTAILVYLCLLCIKLSLQLKREPVPHRPI